MKRSFILLEVVVSFIILAVVIGALHKSFERNDNISRYYQLQDIENHFIKSKEVLQSEEIKFR